MTSRTEEESRALQQERLAMFGGSVFLISIGVFVLSNLASFLDPSHTFAKWFTLPSNRYHLAQAAMLLSTWVICRVRPLRRDVLLVLDAGCLFLVSTLHGMIGLTWMPESGAENAIGFGTTASPLPIVMATVVIVTTRAILVPSSALRTVGVTALAAVPTIVACHAVATKIAGSTSRAMLMTSGTIIWMIAGTAVAAMASRVIYHLHEQVRIAEKLGQYTLKAKIGEGAMGIVYRASHAMLRRPTAIKLLPPDRAGEHNLARFEREVQLTSMLTHPNTIVIYDYGRTPEGIFYYAMEYLEGMNLEDLVSQYGPQPAARVLRLLLQVAGALAEAHGIGLIHRDIKPANIFVCERGGVSDVAKVLDFGLVKQISTMADSKMSSANILAGTPLYLAPEAIVSPQRVDGRTDLYALGCVGYFLLTGAPVFEGRTLLEICSRHLHEAPRPLSQHRHDVPAELEAIILACLAKNPADRPTSARDLTARLARCDAGEWTEADARRFWAKRSLPPGEAANDRELDSSTSREFWMRPTIPSSPPVASKRSSSLER